MLLLVAKKQNKQHKIGLMLLAQIINQQKLKKYIAELEADIMPIDGLIAFANSEMGFKFLVKKWQKNVLAHAQDIKAKGAKYCDCPACKAVADILAKKEQML